MAQTVTTARLVAAVTRPEPARSSAVGRRQHQVAADFIRSVLNRAVALNPGTALVAAAADADPVTRLVLGWLAGKQSENTRTAYARDIGIAPERRAGHAPSWLAWCRSEGVHPVTGVTGLHVALYARQLAAAELSSASAARKLTAVAGWYAWLAGAGISPPARRSAWRGRGSSPLARPRRS
jgi:hypothetical protein